MTIRVNGVVVRVPGAADVFNWSNEELRRFNPFRPRSENFFDFGSLKGAQPSEANAVFDEQLTQDLREAGNFDDDLNYESHEA